MEGLNPSVYDYIISKIPKDQVLLNEEMKSHTTFRVGGPADALIKIGSPEQLSVIIPFLNRTNIPYFIKGNGSNILVSDAGYRGVIIELSDCFNDIRIEGNTIEASAGAMMSAIAHRAMENSLSGFEFASGIPGTIGGGVVMNAGAYGGELKDVVTKVKVMNSDGEILMLNKEAMQFGYRNSIIKNRPFIVLSVTIELLEGCKESIKEKMDELNAQRRTKQPLEYPSAGSTFKRPEGYFAGKLIMDCGLRGYSLGGAAVSEKHCGFVVNKHNACAADISELILDIIDRVDAKFGVTLEPEIIFLGKF